MAATKGFKVLPVATCSAGCMALAQLGLLVMPLLVVKHVMCVVLSNKFQPKGLQHVGH